jgi:hypothetical protein
MNTVRLPFNRLTGCAGRDFAACRTLNKPIRVGHRSHRNAATACKPISQSVPVRQQDDHSLQVVSFQSADGEVLNITTLRKTHSSPTAEGPGGPPRSQPRVVSRGRSPARSITRVTTMPGGTCVVTLKNEQRLPVSRIQSRILREQLLRL